MMKWLFRIVYPVICIGLGWALGATYRAPPIVIETTDKLVIATRDSITKALEIRQDIVAENTTIDAPIKPTGKTGPGAVAPAPVTKEEVILESNGLSPFVTICKGTKVANAPAIDSHGHVIKYKQLKNVDEIAMAMMPVRNACISSGFGPRKGKRHKGLDYYSKTGGSVFAAGDGQIIEAEYRNDYGFTVLINHGNNYYTRYAHLEGFTKGVVVGAAVPRGFALGEMGKTAGYNIPIHLHFELLKGDYNTPKKSFGLTPIDLYNL